MFPHYRLKLKTSQNSRLHTSVRSVELFFLNVRFVQLCPVFVGKSSHKIFSGRKSLHRLSDLDFEINSIWRHLYHFVSIFIKISLGGSVRVSIKREILKEKYFDETNFIKITMVICCYAPTFAWRYKFVTSLELSTSWGHVRREYSVTLRFAVIQLFVEEYPNKYIFKCIIFVII